jgi:hypothetical protein
MDADRCAFSTQHQRRSVAHVALPELVGQRRLPAKARLGSLAVAQSHTVQPLLAQELADCAGRDLATLDASVRFERAQDERDQGVGALAANAAEQGPKLGAKIAPAASIRASRGA